MEHHILIDSVKHFSQAEGSTLTQKYTRNIIVDDFNNKSDEILDGTFQPPLDMDPLQAKYFSLLKRNPTTITYTPYIPIDQVRNGFKKWREVTLTSPSGIHLGHYKALLANDGTKNPVESSGMIWYIITLLINSCI